MKGACNAEAMKKRREKERINVRTPSTEIQKKGQGEKKYRVRKVETVRKIHNRLVLTKERG